MSFQSEKLDRLFKSTLLIGVLILVVYFAGNIIFPIILAGFVVLSLKDLMKWFDKRKIPTILSALLVTLLIVIIVTATILLLIKEGIVLTSHIQLLSGDGNTTELERFFALAHDKFNQAQISTDDSVKSMLSTAINASGNILSAVLIGLQSALLFLSLIPIYIFFMLTYRHRVSAFLSAQYDYRREKEIRKIIDDMSLMLRKYLLGLLTVITIVGVLNSIGLTIIGLDHALFFGFATALLMIIPYIGVIVGSIVPALFALITLDSPWYALIVLGMYAVIQFIEGNYITPKIIGESVNLNPLSIIIGMIVLGLIGGTLALVLAVPIIATIRILFANSKRYKHVAILLENE